MMTVTESNDLTISSRGLFFCTGLSRWLRWLGVGSETWSCVVAVVPWMESFLLSPCGTRWTAV